MTNQEALEIFLEVKSIFEASRINHGKVIYVNNTIVIEHP